MCDTFIALGNTTQDGSLLFSKNSDREPKEAQAIVHTPHAHHQKKKLNCTYIEIPQVEETYECILSKPFQMWGAEMGANVHGVVIGNEAVFTKVKFEKHNNGLTGMDMLRLALERSTNADEALQCITNLLETYGQNACGGYKNKTFYYHNSFIIADTEKAWVLETAGKEWAAEKVKDIRSISNALSIGEEPDRLSANAKSYAASKGWWKENKPFHFQQVYTDWLYTKLGRAKVRSACTMNLAKLKIGSLDVTNCMEILQTHNLEDPTFKPSKANTASICMHATSIINPSESTGSMVAQIRKGKSHSIWLSGTAHPCLSVYLPYYFGTHTLDKIIVPSDKPDQSLWWKAEKLHRWILKDYQKRKALIQNERNDLQTKIIKEESILFQQDVDISTLGNFSNQCLTTYQELLNKWTRLITTYN
jgi:dipeptidase